MQQHELRQPKGATHKRKRVGRGNASGHGTYATKGLKGQKARSGGGVRIGFEGGQLPFIRRMARKRGFTNRFRVDYEEVNVGKLAALKANSEVTEQSLRAARLVRGGKPVKILGVGDLSVALTVEASSFSASAKQKIEAAGGTVRWLNGEPQPKEATEAKPKRARATKAAAAETEGKQAEAQDSAGSDKEQEEASDGAGS
jgi:large subunit ribosomal protein L15